MSKPPFSKLHLVLVLPFISAFVLAQTKEPQQPASVTGISGQIEIARNLTHSAAVVAITPQSERGSSPIVFILQYAATSNPSVPEWSGMGRVLLSDGVFAVIGEDGSKRLFKFPERQMPASMQRIFTREDALEIVGIGVHGQTTPLTSEQVAMLKATATCSAISPKPGSGRSNLSEASPMNVPACTSCSSGGEGATQCGSGVPFNCTVTCSGKYFACCNSANGTCICCLN